MCSHPFGRGDLCWQPSRDTIAGRNARPVVAAYWGWGVDFRNSLPPAGPATQGHGNRRCDRSAGLRRGRSGVGAKRDLVGAGRRLERRRQLGRRRAAERGRNFQRCQSHDDLLVRRRHRPGDALHRLDRLYLRYLQLFCHDRDRSGRRQQFDRDPDLQRCRRHAQLP